MHQFFVSAGSSSGTTTNPAPGSGSSAESEPAPNGNPSPAPSLLSEEQRRSLLPDLSSDEQRLICLTGWRLMTTSEQFLEGNEPRLEELRIQGPLGHE